MRKRIAPSTDVCTPAEPHVIQPTAIYYPEDVRRIFRLRNSSIRSEKRAGRLRVARRCNRYYILGAWLLEWIAGGEQSSRHSAERVSSGVANRPVKEDEE